MYVLLQWRKAAKGRWRFAKGLNTTIYKPINKRKPDHIPMSRFCWGAKGRERCAKRGVRAVFGYIILDNPTYIYMIICIILYNIYIGGIFFLGMFFFQSWAFFFGFLFPFFFAFLLLSFCFSLLFPAFLLFQLLCFLLFPASLLTCFSASLKPSLPNLP